jgi:hypothetical protein
MVRAFGVRYEIGEQEARILAQQYSIDDNPLPRLPELGSLSIETQGLLP